MSQHETVETLVGMQRLAGVAAPCATFRARERVGDLYSLAVAALSVAAEARARDRGETERGRVTRGLGVLGVYSVKDRSREAKAVVTAEERTS